VPSCCCERELKITIPIDVKYMTEANLLQLAINGDNWDTLYQCKHCKTFWEERYTGGRWDGWPELYKVNSSYVAEKWGGKIYKVGG